jgi:hypothetical protein
MTDEKHPRVSELPYIESLNDLSEAEREQYGLYLKGGGINVYRLDKMRGRGGSRLDPQWDKLDRVMTCCGSKVYWRHKVACPLLRFDFDE